MTVQVISDYLQDFEAAVCAGNSDAAEKAKANIIREFERMQLIEESALVVLRSRLPLAPQIPATYYVPPVQHHYPMTDPQCPIMGKDSAQ